MKCESLCESEEECPSYCRQDFRYCLETPWRYPSYAKFKLLAPNGCLHFNKWGQWKLGESFYLAMKDVGK